MTVKKDEKVARAKAGKLITSFIRNIAKEQTEYLRDENGILMIVR